MEDNEAERNRSNVPRTHHPKVEQPQSSKHEGPLTESTRDWEGLQWSEEDQPVVS